MGAMSVVNFYYSPDLETSPVDAKLRELQDVSSLVKGLELEFCYNVEVSNGELTPEERTILKWLLSSPFSDNQVKDESQLTSRNSGSIIFEVGPRLSFSTPFSTNAVAICKIVGLEKVTRIELTNRYLVIWQVEGLSISQALMDQVLDVLRDRMVECQYLEPIQNFVCTATPAEWSVVDIMTGGRKNLDEVNKKMGLALDEWDLNFYYNMFTKTVARNPTTVECFDLAQSNSEHSRHWFFKGDLTLNNEPTSESLMEMITKTQMYSNSNNVIKFSDNSSAIRGFIVEKLKPRVVGSPSAFEVKQSMTHITFTAETHNFPTGVAPFSGATTGTGGRIRDNQAVGRGGHCIAGTAGYCVGNLYIRDHCLPWEESKFLYPHNMARPLNILIQASNGASDYGNKFGEPVIAGFTRSFGMRVPNGDRREWVKPIMFSGGIGALEDNFIHKQMPEKGMKVVKVGGPVYRIGVGGGSASSIRIQGDNRSDLDFGAVQRGDPEMENKMNRLVRACIEAGEENPICSIHDQGAGGNGNVLKELVHPAGAVVFSKAFTLGDKTVSTLEIWGAEYQESNAILVKEDKIGDILTVAKRERCPLDIVGVVTGNGSIILSEEEKIDEDKFLSGEYVNEKTVYPVNMNLELVLGNMPRKKFLLEEEWTYTRPLEFVTQDLTVMKALERVLRLVSVGSKRFLTNKVDRCVTGLVAQQQCVGPLHTPLADFAVTALSMFSTKGVATAIGEQPIKGLINPAAGARTAVAEALSNLMFAKISDLKDVKCSGNWMYAAKIPEEGAALYRACEAMCKIMYDLGIAVDGGKDSLSMATRFNGGTIKSPGSLVVSVYAPCPDIQCLVTPDLKSPRLGQTGILLWVKLSTKCRLGGSALAQCYSELGVEVPDVENSEDLKNGFKATQNLISGGKILAGHDISDGGFIVCLLEMAFAGISGLRIIVPVEKENVIEEFFSEEVGWILEVAPQNLDEVISTYGKHEISCVNIGQTTEYGMYSLVSIKTADGKDLLKSPLHELFRIWEDTSYHIEKRQANPDVVHKEFNNLRYRKGPDYKVSFDPEIKVSPKKLLPSAPKVAVLREEGSNGDREMVAALHMVGFEVWDLSVQDLLDDTITIDRFNGIVFPGGFSFADVLGAAKGWAACLIYNQKLSDQMAAFAKRPDSFSLGVCNGCQLMALLGWLDPLGTLGKSNGQPEVMLTHNLSGRFECRFVSVKIEQTHAIMCKGMEDSILGVWVAHGEGRFTYRDYAYETLTEQNCVAFRYVDDNEKPTEVYPMNPNGSRGGVAGLCSADGRHLALMPHPERSVLMWQWPYISPSIRHLKVSPWLKLFENAFVWVNEQAQA